MKNKPSPDVVFHCIHVAMKARELAEKLQHAGYQIDSDLCFVGGLLHDIGRVLTHSIRHGIEGAALIRQQGWPEALALVIERHLGGGIPRAEAVDLGLPAKDYVPTTIEEKVVCYADKLFIYSYDTQNRITKWREVADCSLEAKKLQKRLGGGHLAPTRLLKLEKDLKSLCRFID